MTMALTSDQLAVAIDYLRPKAAYKRYDTYANLAATWEDAVTTCPTEAELEAAWTLINSRQSITALNQDAAAKITAKEKYYAAVVTSSLYTDAEITTIVAQIKADKLAIYNDTKAKQEAIING
jgi:hypothetical protein